MALSNDLVHEFVKVTNDGTEIKQESTVYGTIVKLNNATYVRIDGSDLLTPIISTVAVSDGDRVTVMIKNHTATVTGNTSSPAAKDSDLSDLSNVVADKVSTEELEAEKARISDLEADTLTVKDKLTANEAYISDLQADNVEIKNKLTAAEGSITKLETEKLDANAADIKFATIENLEVTNETVRNIQGDFATFEDATVKKLTAHDANIDDLYAKKLSAVDADIKYANIDFSNIGQAAMEYFYSQSGLIKNVVVGDQTITGELVGVTIRGDLIEANTVVADKLVIKGTDGLYYKLNTDGVTTESEQTDYNSLNGQIIRAKSVTAEKIAVEDLVAFGATIGGFRIGDTSIYSGVKSSVDNTTRGIYMDNQGQMAIGDASNFIKYYKDQNGVYKLVVSAKSIQFGTNGTNLETAMSETQRAAKEAYDKAQNAQNSVDEVEQKIEFVVGSGSTASSVTLTEAAIQAITRQFTIKDYSGGTTVIRGGKIITDDLRSLSAKIAGWEIGDGYIRDKDVNNQYVGIGRNNITYAFFAGGTAANGSNANFRVDHAGQLIATDAIITGNITATSFSMNQAIDSVATAKFDVSSSGLSVGIDDGEGWGGWITATKDSASISGHTVDISSNSGNVYIHARSGIGISTSQFIDMTGDVTIHGPLTINGGAFYKGNDAADWWGGRLNNLVIESWWGISFTTNCGGQAYSGTTAVSIDCRNGSIRAGGDISTAGGLDIQGGWMDLKYNGTHYGSIFVNNGTNGALSLRSSNNAPVDIMSSYGIIQCVNENWSAWAVVKAKQFSVQSSKRYKTNIVDMTEDRANLLLSMRPVSYDYTVMGCEKDQLGMIAEEVDAVDKFALTYDEYGRPDSLDYSKFVPQLIKLCQIQQKQIDELKTEVNELKGEVTC